ncbi:glycoprotein gp2 [alpha proteobacterium U9-1i]|nr:glycoprotein gp2 [alpha proteobacterium U9-1i]
MRWLWVLGAVGAVCLGLTGCVTAMLPVVKLDPAFAPAAPPALLGAFADDLAITTRAEWEARRAPLLRARFAAEVYGPYPTNVAPPRVLSRDPIAYERLADIATVEQWSVAVGNEDTPPHFNMVLVLPRGASTRTPLIIMQNFCGNRAALPDAPAEIAGPLTEVLWVCDANWAHPLIEMPFGRYINAPPYADILARGYGLAMFYAGDVVADTVSGAPDGMRKLYGADAPDAGAIAAWAWLYSQAYDVLAADPRIDAARIAIWGHSRNGKAALYAGALDHRFAAIIAHQSGRGGAALSSGTEGESIAKMIEAFPHWFAPAYANAPSSPAMDQHQLLALNAPTPVLLGNGARDAWADPHAAWAAAQAASPAYGLYDVEGFSQTEMRNANVNANLAYFMRPGLHGVYEEDWRVFLDFLDAHLGASRTQGAAR